MKDIPSRDKCFLGPAVGPDWFKYLENVDDPIGVVPATYDGSMTMLDRGWKGLHKNVQALYRELEMLSGKQGLWIRMTEGYRPRRRQAYLYALGRDIQYVGRDGVPTTAKHDAAGTPHDKQGVVTNAKPGQSHHQSGRAFDIRLTGKTVKEWYHEGRLTQVSVIGKRLGLEWGGDWPGTLRDLPHYQVPDEEHDAVRS